MREPSAFWGIEWRDTTQFVFDEIKRVAEHETDGDYKRAWEICYMRFTWS